MSRLKKVHKYFEEYFLLRGFERKGLALVLLLGMLLFLLRIPKYTEDDRADIDRFAELFKNETKPINANVAASDVLRLSSFDPNIVRKETLFEMGLPPSAVKSIINFRRAGFQYRKPADLLKCFGVDQVLFEELAPYVVILDHTNDKRPRPPQIRPFEFDPNVVTRSDLEAMNLPSRFITGFLNYRNSGAQFYTMADMEKVYSMTDDIKVTIQPYLLFPDKPVFKKKPRQSIAPPVAQRFRFDPNLISKDSLLLLGINKSAASIWVNYRNKGKVYYNLDDLRSIYNLSESKIQELSSYMDFPERRVYVDKVVEKKQQPSLNIDPNVASREDLMEIRGIGRYYANRILWRRKKLGGFHSINQIAESGNLPDSTFQAVQYHFISPTVDSLKKINVNTVSRRTFADHPYITYERVDRIISHREFVGPKLSLEYLQKVELLSLEEALKLAPYLEF